MTATHGTSTRFDLFRAAPKGVAAMQRLGEAAAAAIDPGLAELVKMRASQLNGCAYCIDMHTKDALAAGESNQRLYGLIGWHETPYYSDAERAALALTEAVTLIADGGVPDAVWDEAARHFDEEQLAGLLFTIVTINGWNRIAISSRIPPGSYQLS